MNHEQSKYLKARVRSVYIRTRDRVFEEPRKPKHVREAERIVKAWKDAVLKDRYACMDKLDIENEKAMQAILFGDPDTALKALKDFEISAMTKGLAMGTSIEQMGRELARQIHALASLKEEKAIGNDWLKQGQRNHE